MCNFQRRGWRGCGLGRTVTLSGRQHLCGKDMLPCVHVEATSLHCGRLPNTSSW